MVKYSTILEPKHDNISSEEEESFKSYHLLNDVSVLDTCLVGLIIKTLFYPFFTKRHQLVTNVIEKKNKNFEFSSIDMKDRN